MYFRTGHHTKITGNCYTIFFFFVFISKRTYSEHSEPKMSGEKSIDEWKRRMKSMRRGFEWVRVRAKIIYDQMIGTENKLNLPFPFVKWHNTYNEEFDANPGCRCCWYYLFRRNLSHSWRKSMPSSMNVSFWPISLRSIYLCWIVGV